MEGAHYNAERLVFILCKHFYILYRIFCFNAGAVRGFVGDVGDLELFL